jgi:hypothetical protein
LGALAFARVPFAEARFFAGFAAARDLLAGFAREAERVRAVRAVATARGPAGRGVGRSPAPTIGSGRLGGGGSGGRAASPCTPAYHERM